MVVLGLFEDDSQGVQVSSPRTVAFLNTSSTVIASSATSSSSQSPSRGMTTSVTVMNDGNEVSVVIADKVGSPSVAKDTADSNLTSKSDKGKPEATSPVKQSNSKGSEVEAGSPQSQDPTEGFGDYPQLMPQTGSNAGYYLGYNPAEPPSPSPAGLGTASYDAASFFQQPGAFAPLSRVAGGAAASPLSPPRTVPTTMGVVPPASPLFPRATSGGRLSNNAERTPVSVAAPPSPNLGYMSPALGGYQPPYAVVPTVGSLSSDSPDVTWSGYSHAQTSYQQSSPQTTPYGFPVQTRAAAGGRAYSFEETMLPPSALDQLAEQQVSLTYSPYGGSQASPVTPAGASPFVYGQQSWYGAAGAGPPDIYGSSGSPLQPRPSSHPHMGLYAGAFAGGGAMRGGPNMLAAGPLNPYGHYYPTAASSPGPPIQTTTTNKGPDGANLFIFHIPNHFTNLDMYQLFCPYGTLLSVRIMVEKDTGRSRGFGFVSYDNPDSAAMAIKELNGFAIGNKRLKVQHKQIRSSERDGGSFDAADGTSSFGPSSRPPHFNSSSSLPPSGPMASQSLWFKSGQETIVSESLVAPTDTTITAATIGDSGAELTTATSTAVADDLSEPSPLASLGSLQSALPDVSGSGETDNNHATTE